MMVDEERLPASQSACEYSLSVETARAFILALLEYLQALDKLNYSLIDLLGSLLLGPMTAAWKQQFFRAAEQTTVQDDLVHPTKGQNEIAVPGDVKRRDRHLQSRHSGAIFPLTRTDGRLRWGVGSGVHSAIHGKIRPGDVRRVRTGDERDQRCDLVNAPVAVQCCGGFLRRCPVARCGIQLRVDRTRLHVIDRDAPAPDLSGQALRKYLHGSLRGRVGHKPWDQDTLTH